MSDDDWRELFDGLYGAADRVEQAIVERARRGTACDLRERAALLQIFDTALEQKRDLVLRLLDLRCAVTSPATTSCPKRPPC